MNGGMDYIKRIDEIGDEACVNEKGNWRSGVVHWIKFRNSIGETEDECFLKGKEEGEVADALMAFGLYLLDVTEIVWSSISTYLGEARKVLEIRGNRSRIELRARHAAVIVYLKRARKKKAHRKKALTARMLRRWRERLEKSSGGGDENSWASWICMSLAFYGLLRGSELIGRQGKREGIRWRHVSFIFDEAGGLEAVDLYIARSKTDAFGFGAKVRIFADAEEQANPVWWLYEKWLEEKPNPEDYVVEGASKGRAVSYHTVNSAMQNTAKLEGEAAKDWGTHSGRAGGCTAMFLGGATGDQVKAAGRWSSDVYWRYVRVCPITRKTWMQAMSGVAETGSSWAIPLDEMSGRAA